MAKATRSEGPSTTSDRALAEQVDMQVTGREPSDVPGQVGAHLLPGRDPASAADVARLNTPVHWVHGVTMGAVRGALDSAGVRGPAASAAHFALVWGGDAALRHRRGLRQARRQRPLTRLRTPDHPSGGARLS